MIGSMEVIALEAAETSRVAFSTIAELASAICEGHLDNWSQRMLKQARICLEVTGREHIEQDEDYIVVSNYQSRWDIPVLYQALRIPMQMMETNEIARIPSVAHRRRVRCGHGVHGIAYDRRLQRYAHASSRRRTRIVESR